MSGHLKERPREGDKGSSDRKSFTFFTKTVDELVLFSENDKELADGIKWLDEQAQRKGVSLYEMVFQVLYRHDLSERAKVWARDKQVLPVGYTDQRPPGEVYLEFKKESVCIGHGIWKIVHYKSFG